MSMSGKTFITFIYKIILSFLGFVNGALTARYLNKVDRLDFQFAGTISNTGMTYIGGYSGYYAYALSKRPDDVEDITQMGNLFIFILSLIIWVAALLLRLFMGPHFTSAWLWAFLVMPFSFMFGYGSRLLQGTNEMTWLNRVNLAQPLVFLIIYLPLFFDRHIPEHLRLTLSYTGWTASFAVAAAWSILISYHLFAKHKVRRWRYSKQEWTGMFKYGGWLSISNLVNIANYRMDFWLVKYYIPASIASDYGIAVVASEVLLNISQSITQVVFTRMTGGSRKDAIAITELSSRQTLVSTGIIAIGMYIFFPWLIVAAYGHRYTGALLPFFILLPGLIVKAASNVVLQYYTNQLGSPQTTIVMNGLSAAINAALCVIFLPKLGLVGGAIASTGSYVLSFIVYVYWFGKVNHISGLGLIRIRREDILAYVDFAKRILRRGQ
ncbi:oligosaccharide flippase family protein [Alicyclobacillus mengziensis]|uniref:Polysaccharide biosynthesis C-terminal domain-containing protein n=1 Tax=Alicyclobacillus mengziensis TaxID=2931921 RepID=A0A9X7W0V8_9BACL|nr:polysaccharide biosynthesis C-terminal domain-containing protein [Alicyclobacillus mengziensis]QSO48579.1 polysaccharide biosynthesis C-terminal domain-containing protein [Alicyclobacillus mengziensis]